MPFWVKHVGNIEVVETLSDCLPLNSVVTIRAEGGGVDIQNFLAWARTFVQYVRTPLQCKDKPLLILEG